MRYVDGEPAETVAFCVKSMLRRYDLSDVPYFTTAQSTGMLIEPTKINYPHIDRVLSNTTNSRLFCFQDTISDQPWRKHSPADFFAVPTDIKESGLIGASPDRDRDRGRLSSPPPSTPTSHANRWIRHLRFDDQKSVAASFEAMPERAGRASGSGEADVSAPVVWVLVSPMSVKDWANQKKSNTKAHQHCVRVVLKEDLISSKLFTEWMWSDSGSGSGSGSPS